MSDYIYGSSLRAAKSKANYLFEGDFRRRPNQNLSGASRSVARVELLRQAAEQRQTREVTRHRENACIKLQSVWRAYRCRRTLASSMRARFDSLLGQQDALRGVPFTQAHFEQISREFIILHHSKQDEQRFFRLINLMMQNHDSVVKSKATDAKLWSFRIAKLLKMNLSHLEQCSPVVANSRHLDFLEFFTRPGDILDKTDSSYVWTTLIKSRFYLVIRQVANEATPTANSEPIRGNADQTRLFLLELIKRSLDIESSDETSSTAFKFFEQFLQGPLSGIIEDYYFPQLLRLEPQQLRQNCILRAFTNNQLRLKVSSTNLNLNLIGQQMDLSECKNIIWLCYLFVRALYTRVDDFNDIEKVDYINTIASLIGPAEHITSVSSILAANEDTEEQGADDEDLVAGSGLNNVNSKTLQLAHSHYHVETHQLIKRLVDLINQLHHINSLKPIIFSDQYQPQVQGAIVQICSLMLSHEYLAIFNCRLLYTVAFSKEFSRSLWKSIITTSTTSLYGSNLLIYQLIIRGSQSIDRDSWRMILPRLRLFCSLCSYLLPTLDDDEFYTSELYSDEQSDRPQQLSGSLDGQNRNQVSAASGGGGGGSSSRAEQTETSSSSSSSGTISSFYVDRELVGISATLRDLCVGLVEILYQGNRQSAAARHPPNLASGGLRFDSTDTSGLQDESTKLLSFEIKSCFQALVRLVCQLHARDSRKQFCPDGHWICPSVIIPANKAVDFQMVTSQQGRLLNQITRHDQNLDRLASVSSEIKTVLILQEIPFVISFHDRVQIFHQLLLKERQVHQTEGYHFGLPGTAISVQIRRNYLYEDAFEKLSFDNEPNMKLPLRVSLINAAGADEAGIDGGGLTKEFLDELLKSGFDPMRGFFKYTKDHFLYPNPSANVLFSSLREGYEVHYEFLGRILGKAIFEKIMVELPLASFFLAKLLAVKHSSDVDLHNLESLDPVLYKNLVYLKNYKGDVADLNLDFTISNNELGEHEVVELKPDGSKIPVTRENKIEYVHLVADYRLNKQIRLQCAAFKRGLAQLVDLDWLRMFDPRELQILISGAPTEIDVADWRRHTIYGNGYSDEHKVIKTFWLVVDRFDENQKRKLLKFATSCSLPPLLGFKDLVPQFAIASSEEERLPTASTCMNLLKLPQCEDEGTMRQKLLYAIESNAGFELS